MTRIKDGTYGLTVPMLAISLTGYSQIDSLDKMLFMHENVNVYHQLEFLLMQWLQTFA